MNYEMFLDYIPKWFNFDSLWYERRDYLDLISKYNDTNVIKIISWIRRIWKSYILKQYIDSLLKKSVLLNDIFYLHLEDDRLPNDFNLNDLRKLFNYYIANYKKNSIFYVFLDEIQNIPNWEKFIRSIQEKYSEKCQIFITWSNSNLLSSELSTVLTWRFVEFVVYPFSFKDYLWFKNIKLNLVNPDKYDYFEDYFVYWWMPEIIKFTENETKKHYLNTLVESILFKDIVQRYNIKKTQFLENLLNYIYITTCSLLSVNSIVKYLKQENKILDYDTVNSYLNYLENSFLVNELNCLWIKTKQILKGKKKYYAFDTWIRNFVSNDFSKEKILENLVYLELKRRWYELSSIEADNFEIDFYAKKNNDIIYFQISYSIKNQTTYDREIKALFKIKDSYKKIILTLDDISKNDKGIEIINLIDWLYKN